MCGAQVEHARIAREHAERAKVVVAVRGRFVPPVRHSLDIGIAVKLEEGIREPDDVDVREQNRAADREKVDQDLELEPTRRVVTGVACSRAQHLDVIGHIAHLQPGGCLVVECDHHGVLDTGRFDAVDVQLKQRAGGVGTGWRGRGVEVARGEGPRAPLGVGRRACSMWKMFLFETAAMTSRLTATERCEGSVERERRSGVGRHRGGRGWRHRRAGTRPAGWHAARSRVSPILSGTCLTTVSQSAVRPSVSQVDCGGHA
mmetsp:Transcript_25414/g.70086  ORF Transcript_25414/g.70086 Transcript_25414/m.70086 type:complete len:259 (-) Transcript_25414:1447-2223(-)